MNNRAQLFMMYLVLVTGFFCGVYIGIQYLQNKSVNNSVVSPVSLLILQDSQQSFDVQEKNMIIAAARDSKLTESGDISAFESKFYGYLFAPEQLEFRNFIFSNISLDGKPLGTLTFESDLAKRDLLMGNNIDKKKPWTFTWDGSRLGVQRRYLGKMIMLRAPDKSVINFITRIDYSYDKSYSISKEEINSFGG